MLLSADVMRFLIVLTGLGLAVLAALFLRSRRLSNLEYLRWGFILLFIPLLGPFLVILSCPGQPRSRLPGR